MDWISLQTETDVPDFMDAAVELYRPLLDLVTPDERPHFHDEWLRRFNHSGAWRLVSGDRTVSLVTVPRIEDVHAYRWQSRTLVCRDDVEDLGLPVGVDLDRSFTMPMVTGVDEERRSILAETTSETVQYGYGVRLSEVDEDSGAPWEFRAGSAADLESIMELLRVGYGTSARPEPDLTRQQFELRHVMDLDAGWCFVAIDAPGAPPIAMVSYVLLQIPLLGLPAALVADLAVAPEHRGHGLAQSLQRWACGRLREAGVTWVIGNIDPDNHASRRQAEALGRRLLYRAVRFYPIEGR